MRSLFIIAICGSIVAQSAHAADWYVDGLNGSDKNSGTWISPFQTSWKGIAVAQPGDTVHLLPTVTYPQFGVLDKTGTAAAPITIIGDGTAPNLTKVMGGGSNFAINVGQGQLKIPSSYITIANLDVRAPGPWVGVFVGAGSNHITITRNRIHNSGRAGINTYHADYITISHNAVYGNSKNSTTGLFGSGISTYEDTDIDSNTGVKMIIDSNTVYDNTNTPRHPGESCPPPAGGQCNVYWSDSDGNGIIADDLRHTQDNNVPYNGQTLIENNIVYGNGGRGIYINPSDHILIVNNTLFQNNRDPYESSWRPGEIMVDFGGDVQIYNNITYSDGAGCSQKSTGCHVGVSVESGSGGPVISDYNVLFNPQNDSNLEYYLGTDPGHYNTNVVTVGANDYWTDPIFVNALIYHFGLQRSSKALAAGNPGVAPLTDFKGKNRPPNGPTEDGVYQK